MAAAFFKTPELALDAEEATMLSGAIQSVQDFYDFETSAEVMLWVNFAGALAAVYGPRLVAIGMRTKKDKAKKKEAEPSSQNSPVMEGILVPHHAPTG